MSLQNSSNYSEYQQDHAYITDLGYCVMPVLGRTPKFRRIRLHGGIGYRKVQWSASRSGKPPVIPQPVDTGSDLILSHTVAPSLPAPNPDNQAGYNWTIKGEYVYLQTYLRDPAVDALPTGSFPFAIVPNDAVANELVGPQVPAGAAEFALGEASSPAMAVINLLGANTVSSLDYVWPFTATSSTFSDPNLIGA